jgi:hypothetical protein
MIVKAGSVVTCQITSIVGLTNSEDGIVQGVASLLASNGFGVGNTSVQDPGSLSSTGWGTTLPFQASMDVTVPADFGDPSDVVLIVANAFYQVAGSYPTSATWSNVTAPGGAVTAGTPLNPGGIGGADSGLGGSLVGGINNVFAQLDTAIKAATSAGSNLLLGLAILVVIILAIVGWAPNTEKAGRAAAAFA